MRFPGILKGERKMAKTTQVTTLEQDSYAMSAPTAVVRDTRRYNTGRIDNNAQISQGVKKDRMELKRELERRRARDSELVIMKFKNLETPGGVLRFSYKRYAEDQWEKYEFFDGEVYQIKRGVRDHVQKGCYSLVYKAIAGEGQFAVQGAGMNNQHKNARMMVSQKKHRFQCLGLDYFDDDLDGPQMPDIAQVTMQIDQHLL